VLAAFLIDFSIPIKLNIVVSFIKIRTFKFIEMLTLLFPNIKEWSSWGINYKFGSQHIAYVSRLVRYLQTASVRQVG